jgi:hypothetical protein
MLVTVVAMLRFWQRRYNLSSKKSNSAVVLQNNALTHPKRGYIFELSKQKNPVIFHFLREKKEERRQRILENNDIPMPTDADVFLTLSHKKRLSNIAEWAGILENNSRKSQRRGHIPDVGKQKNSCHILRDSQKECRRSFAILRFHSRSFPFSCKPA